MPLIRFLTFKRRAKLVSTIILLGEIMPFYSYCIKRRLLYIIITALSSHQPSSCTKCTQVNMWVSYNIHLVFNAECTFLAYLINF